MTTKLEEEHPIVSVEKTTILLESRGWDVRSMTKAEAMLIPMETNSAVGCIDGRLIDAENETIAHTYATGPKVPGGIIGIGLLQYKDGTLEGLTKACEAMQQASVAPGTHDVIEDHCGAKKLAAAGKYEEIGLPKLTASSQSIIELIKGYQGVSVHLLGEHKEEGMIFNLDPAYTRIPDATYFQADLGWLVSMGIDAEEALIFYAFTVEQLKPDAKIAYIVS